LCNNLKQQMATPDEVKTFLEDFKSKLEFWGVVFLDDRVKNTKTLAILEMNTIQRKKVLTELSMKDYSQGPIADKQFLGSDLWVFGKIIKQNEVYIKITMGLPNKQTICISFHVAEHPMKYPYKTI
jgi:hypothetical protein